MPTVTPREFCETLYCALTPLADVHVGADGDLALTVRVTDAGATTEHRVRFAGVQGLIWSPAPPPLAAPEDLFEFSALAVERDGAAWRVWVHPWYSREVEFRCASASLDGDDLAGTGRWLQDELPARGAS